jgi:hypothetical protein
LGEQFVTNFVEASDKDALKAPLDLVLCDSATGCGLLQLKHTLNHDVLYKKYWYKSGLSTTMVKALANIVSCATQLVPLSSGDIVVDIGANDGTLLRQYKTPAVITVGFEPSNLHELAVEGTSKIINDYFNHEAFKKEFGDKKAKVITSIAMFYDLENPNSFVEDIRKCLHKDGVWIIQMNYLGLMLEENTFDNISHEHLEYYSFFSLQHLLNKHELEAFDVELNDVNGGSFRIYVKHKGSALQGFPDAQKRLTDFTEKEAKMGLDRLETYKAFAQRINTIKNDLLRFLRQEKLRGKKLFIYGASTRGLVVLQYAGVDNKLIEMAADMNPDKWGKYIVGTGIPIVSIDEYRKHKPDYLFVLPYHFLEEIELQEKSFLESGGKMVVAIPKFKVISKA